MSLRHVMLSTASVSHSPEHARELLDVLAQELLEQAREGGSPGAVTEGTPAGALAAGGAAQAPDGAALSCASQPWVLEDCSVCSSGQGSPGGSAAASIRPVPPPAAARQDVADESVAFAAGPAGGASPASESARAALRRRLDGSSDSSEGGSGTAPLSPLAAPGAPTETTPAFRCAVGLAASASSGSAGSGGERRCPRDDLNCHQEIQLPGPAAPLWASSPGDAGGAPPLAPGAAAEAAAAVAGHTAEGLQRLGRLLTEALREQDRELVSLKEGYRGLAEAHAAAEEGRASAGREHAQELASLKKGYRGLAEAHAAAEEGRASAGGELLARVGELETAASKAAEDLCRVSEAHRVGSAAGAAGLERLEGRLAACEQRAEEARGAQAGLAAEVAALRQRAGAVEGLVGSGPAGGSRPRATLAERVDGVERRMGDFVEGYGAEFAATSLKLDRMQIHLAGCEAHLGTIGGTHEAHAREVADLRSRLEGCEEGHICSALAKLAEDSSRLRSELTGAVVRAEELQREWGARLRADLDSLARQVDAVQKRLQGPEERGQPAEPFAAVMCELGHIRSVLSEREGEASAGELHRAQRGLAARVEAAEAGLEALRRSELRRAPGDADRAQSGLRVRVEALQGRLDTLEEAQGQAATTLESFRGWCAGELEGLRRPRDKQHTALEERLDYLEEFLGYSASRHAEQLASAHAKLGQMSGRLSAYEAGHPPTEARAASPQDTPPLGASLRQRIDLLENVVSTLTEGLPGSGPPHSRPEQPRSGSATTRRSPSLDGGVDSAQTAARYAWGEPVHCGIEQTRRLASARHRSVPASRGRGDHARPSGGDSLGAAWREAAAAPPSPASRSRGGGATTPGPRCAVHRGSVHERLKFFEGLSSTPQRTPSTLECVSVGYRPSSMPRSWLGRAPLT